jgi:hypothetical protein
MYVKPNLGSDWRKGALSFLKYMTNERHWRRTWLAFGVRFMCVGIIDVYALEDNDNKAAT